MPSVFLSYSHKDEVWKDRLRKHLGVLVAENLLDVWDDRRIAAGDEWLPEIEAAIDKASVAVLLISADFLTSDFILGKEVPLFLERRASEKTTIFPIIVHPCAWKQVAWLARLQVRPADGRALSSYRGHRVDEELTKISEEILNLAPPERLDYFARDVRMLWDDFLSRVETAFKLREPKARVERIRGARATGDYLRVCRHTGEFTTLFPIGAVEHGLSEASFRVFLDEVDAPYRHGDPQLVSILVYGGEPAPDALIQLAREKRVHLQSFIEFQGLIDFRPYLEKQTRTLNGDLIYPPELYVPQRMRYPSGRDEHETSDALATAQEWLSSPTGRFVVILGDFGTGKTFLLHELARRMGEQCGGLIPILLQMRYLEKGRDLNALLAQHFALEGVEDFSPGRFRYMLEQGRVALLFDGFDELALRITYERATDHFDTLLQAATGAAKVVLTSRRQHFISDHQVKTVLAERAESVPGHRLAILQPFDRDQIRAFLVNFCGDEASAERRLKLIDHVKDLLGLSHNPRLLGFIAELPEEQLLAAAGGDGEITAAGLYQMLLHRWLVGEFERVHPKGSPPGLSVDDRWRGVTALALRLWQQTDPSVGLSDLNEDAARVIEALDSGLAAFQLGSGTLLVRDEDGNFSFLHQSVLEWLVARHAAEELRSGQSSESLAAREMSPLMADFLGSLAPRQNTVTWARSALIASTTEAAKKNALLTLERLGEALLPGAHLAGQDLRGKDLSYQDLTAADLTGADLTGARLVGTNLTAASLRGAKLLHADLTEAVMLKADLSHANFMGAQLLAANLRGALLDGTIFRRAKLLASKIDPGLSSQDFSGATLNIERLSEIVLARMIEELNAMTLSFDGEILATAEKTFVRLWEVSTGREIRRISGHAWPVLGVAFSADGQFVASASADDTIGLWDISTGRRIRLFLGHVHTVWSLSFSPDDQHLASAASDETLRIWDVSTGQEVDRVTEFGVSGLGFSPDGQVLAIVSKGKIRLRELSSGRETDGFVGDCLSFSPDGRYLATARGASIRIYEISSREVIQQFLAPEPINCLRINPSGRSFLAGAARSKDAAVLLWEVPFTPEIRHRESTHLPFQGIKLENFASRREVRQQNRIEVSGLAFSPQGRYLASGSDDDILRLWEVSTGQEIRRLSGCGRGAFNITFSPSDQYLASGTLRNAIVLWDIDSSQEICQLKGHSARVGCVRFSFDGRYLASGSEDHSIRLWDVASRQEIQIFQGHQDSILDVLFSPDGRYLFSQQSRNNALYLWEVSSGRLLHRDYGPRVHVSNIAFSPERQKLASGTESETVRIWEFLAGGKVQHCIGHGGKILSVTFSPDGLAVASASADRTVRIWDAATGNEIRRFPHELPVTSVAFSPDGKHLASGSADNAIRLWDVANGTCLVQLGLLPEGWVVFSPDGRYKMGGIPAGGFRHVINLCRFEAGELDEWVPGLHLPDDASFFDLPPWTAELRRPARLGRDGRTQ